MLVLSTFAQGAPQIVTIVSAPIFAHTISWGINVLLLIMLAIIETKGL